MNLAALLANLQALQTMAPILLSAYDGFKAIWLKANPGKTEADYQEYLKSSSARNVADTSILLMAEGYVQQPDGSWKKPE